MNNNIFKKDLLVIYRNYLFALEERKEHGIKYGDIDEIIKYYEDTLGISKNPSLVLKKDNKKY